MTEPRYVVRPIPYGPTDGERRAPWQVVDTRPEIEDFLSPLGVAVTETKPPPRRQVAFCLKESHANRIALALTFYDDHIRPLTRPWLPNIEKDFKL